MSRIVYLNSRRRDDQKPDKCDTCGSQVEGSHPFTVCFNCWEADYHTPTKPDTTLRDEIENTIAVELTGFDTAELTAGQNKEVTALAQSILDLLAKSIPPVLYLPDDPSEKDKAYAKGYADYREKVMAIIEGK